MARGRMHGNYPRRYFGTPTPRLMREPAPSLGKICAWIGRRSWHTRATRISFCTDDVWKPRRAWLLPRVHHFCFFLLTFAQLEVTLTVVSLFLQQQPISHLTLRVIYDRGVLALDLSYDLRWRARKRWTEFPQRNWSTKRYHWAKELPVGNLADYLGPFQQIC